MIVNLIKKFYRIVPAGVLSAVIVGAILYLTLAPQPLGDDAPDLFEGADKVVHAIMFGSMAFALALDTLMGKGNISVAAICVIVAVTIASGWGIEWLQDKMELGRSADSSDGIADTIGTILAILIFLPLRKSLRQ